MHRAWRWFREALYEPLPRYRLQLQMRPPQLQGVLSRQYQLGDFQACLELCRLNAPDRFPGDTLADFEAYLKEQPPHYLVVEHEGRIIASRGYAMHYLDFVNFVYGLVHPDWQKQGLGRLLFFARVAQLPFIESDTWIQICAVQKSLPYYEKLDFVVVTETWKDADEQDHPIAQMTVNAFLIYRSQQYLQKVGVSYPDRRAIQPEGLILLKDREPVVEMPEETPTSPSPPGPS
jgi:[ribosomal protein S18]-alanine N-acetyltransferase